MRFNLIFTISLIMALLAIVSTLHTPNFKLHNTVSQSNLINHLQNISSFAEYSKVLNQIQDGLTISPPNAVSTDLITILNFTIDDCKRLSSTQKQNLSAVSATVQTKLTSVSDELAKLEVNGSNYKIRLDVKNQQNYVSQISKFASSDCTNTTIVDTSALQTNILSDRWTLGNLTMQDIIKEYATRSIQEKSVANCPIQTPFATAIGCIDCQAPTVLFNMGAKTCQNCPPSTIFNVGTRKCQPDEKNSTTVYQTYLNTNRWLLGNKTMDNVTKEYALRSMKEQNVTNCPLATPFWDGIKCIDCVDPNNLFRIDTLTCTSCKSTEVFNLTTRSCETINTPITTPIITPTVQPNATNPAGFPRVISTTTPTNTSTDVPCAKATPFFNGVSCIDCTSPNNLFDSISQKCSACNQTSVFNPKTNQCEFVQNKPNATNPASFPNVLLAQNQTLPNNSALDIICPTLTPYFNGNSCIDCPSPNNLFDLTNKNCTACNSTSVFNKTSQKCDLIPLKPNATNPLGNPSILLGDNQKLPVNGSNDVVCPQQKPFFNGSSCINCPNPNNLFDLTNKNCTACNSTSVFNKTTQKCDLLLSKPNATNPLANANILLGPNQKLPVNGPNDVVCPLNTAYFNGSACIDCSAPNNLFDLTNKNCTSCNSTSIFNATTHICDVIPLKPNATNSLSYPNILLADNQILPVNNSKDIACPQDKPYFNGTDCINCSSPNNLFSLTNKNCTACDSLSVFNKTTQKCDKIPPNATNPNSNNRILLADGQNLPVNGSKDILCPQQLPFYNGSSCLECTNPNNIFDLTKKNCTACNQSFIFNETSHKCQKLAANATNPVSYPKILLGDNQKLPVNGSTDILCPADKPYFDGKTCISCTSPTDLFILTNKTCGACPTQYIYNSTTHKCDIQILPSNATNPNSYDRILLADGQKLPANSTYDINCPSEAPFFNGSICLNCVAPQNLYDLTKKNCTVCPDLTVFNTTTHKCDPMKNEWLTSKTAPRLINAGQVTPIWDMRHDDLLKANPNLKDCPAITPFYNGQSCIDCFAPTQYFNLDTRKCQDCSGDFIYKPEQRECMDQSGGGAVSSSTLKMSGSFLTGHKLKQITSHMTNTNRHLLKSVSAH